jgi:SAM-dependent methyltransferase
MRRRSLDSLRGSLRSRILKARRRLAELLSPLELELPASLSRRVTIAAAAEPSDGELYRIFASTPEIHRWHHYFPIFERYLQRYRARPIRLLEIGVMRGGSLRMWKRYFHPGSTIVGLDIDPACARHEAAAERIYVRVGDQADRALLAAVNHEHGPFDVIIDDGSHRLDDQLASFGALFGDALADDGCYLVEDLHTGYWEEFTDARGSFLDVARQLIDVLHEPYLDRREAFFRDEVPALNLSYLSAHLAAIHVHDSLVVLEKARRSVPRSALT